ncbi:MAG: heme biosynthesis protein HemY [Chromatiales bacterium]|nr:heme biosynthesis protein HemY [Gammaproteobacteria bacterium]MBW6476071.1 heme biosynthesis protein HemY [Chromatiales bacterium]
MKFLFAALLALTLGVSLTLLAQRDPGYVLFSYLGWTVETSLTVYLLLQILAFALFYFGLRLLWLLWHLPSSLSRWRERRRVLRAHRLTNRGLIALAEGHWSQAERRLSRAASRSDTPLINYLGAARAAQKQGEEGRRDAYLAQAYQSMPEAKLAIGLTQAELQLAQGQLEQALASLRELRRVAPRHVHVLYLLKKLYEKLQSWQDLHQLLPELRRHHVLEGEALAQFEQNLYHQLLDQAKQLESLQHCWQELPKARKQQADFVAHYAQRLVELGEGAQAEQLLRGYLSKRYDADLAARYAQLDGAQVAPRLALLEPWLEQHPADPVLLLALARLALRNQLWGKARSYLEASLAIEAGAEARHALAELLIQLGEKDQALAVYRQQLP